MTIKKSPRESAWLPSKLFFCWVWEILRLGSKRELEVSDLYRVLKEDRSEDLGNQLERVWKEQLTRAKVTFSKWDELVGVSDKDKLLGLGSNSKVKKRPRFWRALFRIFGFQYLLLGIVAFLDECVLKILQPLFLGQLILFFDRDRNPLDGYLYAGGVVLCSAIYVAEHHPYFFGLQHVGMRSRIAVSSLVYRKVLRLSVTALQSTTIGQMVNFLSNDMSRFDQAPLMAWYLLVGPVQLVIVTYILWSFYSYVCLVGVVFLILFIPFQSLMGNLFGRMRKTVAGRSDKRIRVMNEIVSAIRVIKMYTWEEPFSKLVTEARADEMRALRTVANLKTINFTMYYISSKVVIFLTLLAYVLTGNFLTAEKVFVTLALYNNVRIVLTLFFPFGMASFAELLISIRRLENFLLLEERDAVNSQSGRTVTAIDDFDLRKRRASGGAVGVIVKNLQAKWCPDHEEWTLNNVSMQVKRGQLVAVIGTVGSSKSSLLQAILGELSSVGGQIQVKGRLAFASQEPWIFSGTVRENILFGKTYDSSWYSKVIDACALTRDFELLPYSDSSLVGDRGISLSGGQKARVNLARAVYADRDIYLLDDPLSAVDAEVGKHLFEKCIRGILRKKAVVLVTHQIQFLRSADEVLILNGGKVEAEGSYFKLKHSGMDFKRMLSVEEPPGGTPPPMAPVYAPPATPTSKVALRKISSDTGLSSRLASMEMSFGAADFRSAVTEFEDDAEFSRSVTFIQVNSPLPASEDQAFVLPSHKSGYGTFEKVNKEEEGHIGGGVAEEELRSSGSISLAIYWTYIKSGSNSCTITILILSALATQILFTGSDFYLQYWTQVEETLANRTMVDFNFTEVVMTNSSVSWFSDLVTFIEGDRNAQIGIYSGLILLLFVALLCRTITFTKICLNASVNLHRALFKGVIRSPMKFFEGNPVGRILNRFARDVGVIDEYLPMSLFDTWEIPFQGVGVFIVVGLMSPILLLPAVALLLVFYFVRRFYLKTARSLKRLESISRSPVFSHLSSSFHGLATIRALEVEPAFICTFDTLQDAHSSAWYLFLSTSRWVAITLDWVAIVYVAIVTFSFLGSNLDGSQVGLAVSSTLTLTGLFQWGVRQSAEAENHMVSVERVLEYSQLDPEPPLYSSPDKKPPENWPSKGEIKMQNLFLRYGEDEPVLKDISLKINSMEKIGIVGRTGAGKSSIISTLFRMVDPWKGSIEIDDLDIVQIGLHDLRSKISIIPQDPVLFLGSLRRNLDPFSEFSDLQLWSALEDVHLKDSIQELPSGLQSEISEGGANFSVGERQLICLARAILRNNKILVLDEATANVDPTTDGLIQATIRAKFCSCTVLTVAHRLNTVMDSDRILVLDGGRVLEFDSPWQLLQNEGALFQLTQQTGTASAEALRQVAKDAFEREGTF